MGHQTLSIPNAMQLHRSSIVAVTHDHRPIAEDLPLMIAGGVTSKVFQVTLDVDVEAGYEASATREDGWLEIAVQGIETAISDIESNSDR